MAARIQSFTQKKKACALFYSLTTCEVIPR